MAPNQAQFLWCVSSFASVNSKRSLARSIEFIFHDGAALLHFVGTHKQNKIQVCVSKCITRNYVFQSNTPDEKHFGTSTQFTNRICSIDIERWFACTFFVQSPQFFCLSQHRTVCRHQTQSQVDVGGKTQKHIYLSWERRENCFIVERAVEEIITSDQSPRQNGGRIAMSERESAMR